MGKVRQLGDEGLSGQAPRVRTGPPRRASDAPRARSARPCASIRAAEEMRFRSATRRRVGTRLWRGRTARHPRRGPATRPCGVGWGGACVAESSSSASERGGPLDWGPGAGGARALGNTGSVLAAARPCLPRPGGGGDVASRSRRSRATTPRAARSACTWHTSPRVNCRDFRFRLLRGTNESNRPTQRPSAGQTGIRD